MHVAFVAEKKKSRRRKYNTFRTCTVCRAVFSLQIANFIIGPPAFLSLLLSLAFYMFGDMAHIHGNEQSGGVT